MHVIDNNFYQKRNNKYDKRILYTNLLSDDYTSDKKTGFGVKEGKIFLYTFDDIENFNNFNNIFKSNANFIVHPD